MTGPMGLRKHVGWALLFTLGMVSIQADAQVDYTVNANVLAGTCTVTVTPDTPTMTGVDPEILAKGGLHSVTPIKVALACSGSADNGTPTLNIAGETVAAPDNPDGQYLFRSNDSAVKDIGFVLSKTDGAGWDPNNFVTGNADITLGGAGVSYTGGSTDFWVSVGCGGTQACAETVGKNPDDAGLLKASIRFTFAYK